MEFERKNTKFFLKKRSEYSSRIRSHDPQSPISSEAGGNDTTWPRFQRPILNFTPRGLLGPQGWNLSPRENVHAFVHPQG
jgi:hypothetical protein